MPNQNRPADVTVLGAGPYGLSVAAHTRAAGLRTRLLGKPMNTWAAHMPSGMLLKSECWASHLSSPAAGNGLDAWSSAHGRPYGHGTPVRVEDFIDYGRWFAENAAGGDVEETAAVRLAGAPGRYEITTADGEVFRSRTVVLALGVLPFAHRPDELDGLAPEVATHAGDLHDLSPFKGRKVAVIGAGQSALETAVLLAEAGAEPHLVARKDALRWNGRPTLEARSRIERLRAPEGGLGPGWPNWIFSNLPAAMHRAPSPARMHTVRTALGPAGAWWLRDRFEGVVPTLLGHRLVRAAQRGDGVRLELEGEAGRHVLDADHVVAGTGYRVDLDRLALIDPQLRAGIRTREGFPVLDPHLQSSMPGLYVVGLAAAGSFGPVMRFVYGAPFAAKRVAARLERGRSRAAKRAA
ncbi:hypothetical protein BIV57_18655 [Mangrovactinospora gilvigrisea]|uniref:FAD/NAD(P)-binding domain-containing protein n=1 Tax=Mangrovactinospora gilvigrisea TaxID=1428644 RepID=A0A1J7BBL9_9ACTN|nr:FAD-dependent oxidoreductase [Mangrovactinospora gilvigrisea]OIV35997.1 hypothetical protein BIV57_18655 [Mangrovactinospora gilvigrisea]